MTRNIGSHVIGALVSVAVGGFVLVWAYDAMVPALTIRSEKIATKTVPAGGTLVVDYGLTRYRHCPAVVYRFLFDGRGIQHPVEPYAVPARPLGPDRLSLDVPIPADAAPGEARFQLAYTHVCRLANLFNSQHPVSRPYLAFVITKPERSRMPQP